MKPLSYIAIILCTLLCLSGCGSDAVSDPEVREPIQQKTESFSRSTPIEDVMRDPAFGGFGRLLFPLKDYYYSGDTLEELQLVYYSHIDPEETMEIVNTLHERAEAGQTIFYDIYTDVEKASDPAKRDTGLFFFKGTHGEKFAVCNAGGAFA